MQPLTPAERREIESLKNAILKVDNATAYFITAEEEYLGEYIGTREIWLKVLTMALETNEAIEASWKNSYKARGEAYVEDFDDAKRRLGR